MNCEVGNNCWYNRIRVRFTGDFSSHQGLPRSSHGDQSDSIRCCVSKVFQCDPSV